MTPKFAAIWLAAVAAGSLVACDRSGDRPGAEAPGAERVLRRGNGGEPRTLDPALADDNHAINVLIDVYEGLTTLRPDGTPTPGVAESWRIDNNGLTYIFHLRPDARWSDGTPVLADHFVAGFRRVLAPDTTSPYAFLLDIVQNAVAVRRGELQPSELGIRAIDSATLQIDLEVPAPYFTGILAMPIAFPQHPRVAATSPGVSSQQEFIGNGPYLLQRWSLGERITLVRNPEFHSADSVAVESIDYLPIVEPDTELRMYRAGELEITATVPPAAISDLTRRRPAELLITPSLALYYLAFDMSEPPFDDVAIRQALTMAIDRETLVGLIGRGEQPAFGLVPPGVANYEASRFAWREEDRETREQLARAAYDEAGYSRERPLQVVLTYDTGDIHETVALAVSAMWRDALGVEVELAKKEWLQFLADRQNRNSWQIMRFAWTGDFNDAMTFAGLFTSDSPQNLPAYRNTAYDDFLQRATGEMDATARAALMAQAESLLLAEYPIAPLYFYVNKHLVAPNVGGFEPNVLDRHPSRYLRLSH